jgi:hypothetical protein
MSYLWGGEAEFPQSGLRPIKRMITDTGKTGEL